MQGSNPHPPELEDKVLTLGHQGSPQVNLVGQGYIEDSCNCNGIDQSVITVKPLRNVRLSKGIKLGMKFLISGQKVINNV